MKKCKPYRIIIDWILLSFTVFITIPLLNKDEAELILKYLEKYPSKYGLRQKIALRALYKRMNQLKTE